MKKLIKIMTIVGVVTVIIGITFTVTGIARGGSNLVKEEMGKTFAKFKANVEKNDTTWRTKLQNYCDTILLLSVNNLRLYLSTSSYDIEDWYKGLIWFSYDADIIEN